MLLFLLINVFNFVSHFAFIIHTPLFAIMKTKKLLLPIAFFASIFTVFPAEVAQTNEIIITGSSSTPNGPPRVPAAPTVETSQTGDIISVYFLADLGNVNITITSETGETMYQNTVTSGYGVSEMIDMLDFSEGSYTITFTNSGSLYLCGTFEI